MAIVDKQQAEAKVEGQQAAGSGERLAPAADMTVYDMFNWLANELRFQREESNRRHESLREEGNRRYESLLGEIKDLRKELNEKFHSLQKQIWVLWMVLGVGFFASGNPENPILNWVFTVLGSR